MIAVGIDLGTTNSVVSIFRKGRVENIPVEGKEKLPSVVAYMDGNIVVGAQAKAMTEIYPGNTIRSAKRHIGDGTTTWTVEGRTFTPVDVAAEVLKTLKKAAFEYLGEPVQNAVISVPAYFNEDQSEATMQAARQAGWNVLRLVAEPTAAAIAYGFLEKEDKTLLVYDLGGGTFDVSILRKTKRDGRDVFDVLAKSGDCQLGGDDFDEEIVKYLASKLRLPIGGSAAGKVLRQKLIEYAEKAKIDLAALESIQILIPDIGGKQVKETLTRADFKVMVWPWLEKTRSKVVEALADAKLSLNDIDELILVGGSTQMPIVREYLTERLKEPYQARDVNTIVSEGAAIWADMLSSPDHGPMRVEECTAHSLGIDMMDSQLNKLTFCKIVEKATTYPVTRGIPGYSVQPYQTDVVMTVFRGEDPNPYRNTEKGLLNLPIRKMRDQVPVIALFELDANQILTFTGVEMLLSEKAKKSMSSSESKNAEREILAFFNQIGTEGTLSSDADVERLRQFIAKGWVTTEHVKIEKPSH